MDDMRREFESSFDGDLERNPYHAYFYDCLSTRMAWESFKKGWQASRAAMVIDLPDTCCGGCDSDDRYFKEGYDEALADCRAMIEAQGLKVE